MLGGFARIRLYLFCFFFFYYFLSYRRPRYEAKALAFIYTESYSSCLEENSTLVKEQSNQWIACRRVVLLPREQVPNKFLYFFISLSSWHLRAVLVQAAASNIANSRWKFRWVVSPSFRHKFDCDKILFREGNFRFIVWTLLCLSIKRVWNLATFLGIQMQSIILKPSCLVSLVG